MRKSFQMATVFTGAAACAAAFAPTAGAATASTTPVARAGAVTASTSPAIRASIVSKECGAGTNTWVHVYFPAGADHGPVCFGDRGDTGVSNIILAGLCGGNNSGWINGYSTDHLGAKYIHFVRGTGERNFSQWPNVHGNLYVTFVSISRFSGGDTCPQ
jgi:hypothetical protein